MGLFRATPNAASHSTAGAALLNWLSDHGEQIAFLFEAFLAGVAGAALNPGGRAFVEDGQLAFGVVGNPIQEGWERTESVA